MLLRLRCDGALTDAQFDVLKSLAVEASRYEADYQYDFLRGHLQGPILADPAVLAKAQELKGLTFRIEIGEATPDLIQNICSTLQEMERKLGRMEVEFSSWSGQPHGQQFNHKVNVHVPGLGLLLINDVEVLEDCCTDKLKDHLNNGWRILAICPQPDQRRPDYVIGRTQEGK